MKKAIYVLLVVLILTSCFPAASQDSASAISQTPDSTVTPTAKPTDTPTPIPTPTLIPTQIGGGSGKLIFQCSQKNLIDKVPDFQGTHNIFTINIDGSNLTQITGELDGYNYINDVSPDGSKVLVTSSAEGNDFQNINLYLVDLNSPDAEALLLATGIPTSILMNQSAAKWIDNSSIVYVGQGESGFGIYTMQADGSDAVNIDRNMPYDILSVTDQYVYWQSMRDRVESGNRHFLSFRPWSTDLAGNESLPLTMNGKQLSVTNFLGPGIAISPDGSKIAWAEAATPGSVPPYHNYLHIASLSDIDHPITYETLSGSLILTWFPDSEKVLVFDTHSSDTSLDYMFGKIDEDPQGSLTQKYNLPAEELKDYLISIHGLFDVSASAEQPIINYHISTGLMGSFGNNLMEIYDISPDGRLIAAGVDGRFLFIDAETHDITDIVTLPFLPGCSHREIIQWLP